MPDQGIVDELQRHIEALREEIASKDSLIGALEHDVEAPLRAEVASLNAQLAAARAAAVPAPPPAPPATVTNAAGSVRVELSDGRQLTISLVRGEPAHA